MKIKSRYNYWCSYNEDLFLYNSYEGIKSVLKISDKDMKEKVMGYMENNNSKLPLDVEAILEKKGYVVDGEIDELLKVRERRKQIIHSDKVTITIIPTLGCNFKCVYCYEEMNLTRMNPETEDKLVKFVDQMITDKKFLFINWFGGEPLLELKKIERITKKLKDVCRSKKVTYLAGITTNGYLLTLENFKRLQKCNVIDYQVTIDGIKEDHNKLRMLKNNQGSFDVIVKNLKLISTQTKSGTFGISVRCNFLRKSMENYEQILNQFTNMFSEDKRFSFTVHAVKDWGGCSVQGIQNEILSEEEEKELFRNALKHNKNSQKQIDFSTHLGVLNGSSNSCYAMGNSNFVIGADGSIYKCTSDFNQALGTLDDLENRKDWIKEEELLSETEECNQCFFYGACKRSICPKAIKLKEKMCPLEKDCIANILGSIRKEKFIKTINPLVHEYKEEN